MRRVEALNQFALDAPAASSEAEIVFAALDMLARLLPLSGAVAVMHAEGGLLALMVRSSDGEPSISEPENQLLVEIIEATPAGEDVRILSAAEESTLPLLRWLDQRHPGRERTAGFRRAVVVFSLPSDLGTAPDLIVCRCETSATDEDEVAQAADLEFLALMRRHVVAALATSRARFDLERRVDQRTFELADANVQLGQRLAELRAAQGQLVEASRKAGMADVATSVLHNVGNVLNSVNVSANMMARIVGTSKGAGLSKAVGLLVEQPDRIRFLAEDPRGQKFVDYVIKVSDAIASERGEIIKELESLNGSIEHIKAIVSKQQSLARSGGMMEPLSLDRLLVDAIEMNAACFDKSVSVEQDFAAVPQITTDRHKLYQILINLLSNARQAVAANRDNPRIVLRTRTAGDEVVIEVEDNGVGISADVMRQLFTQGFTTKPNGHGFGLHASANTARELGGNLTARSDGHGHGACFTIVMPRVPRSRN